jgi:hypothetical protein
MVATPVADDAEIATYRTDQEVQWLGDEMVRDIAPHNADNSRLSPPFFPWQSVKLNTNVCARPTPYRKNTFQEATSA